MAKKRIFTVGCTFPGDEFEYVEFDSDQTLLDADIVLFEPCLQYRSSYQDYNGQPLMTEDSSFTVKAQLGHWHSEIRSAVNAGKVVIVYLAKPKRCYRYTGETQVSGTGRSQKRTNIVVPVSSYEAVPYINSVVPKSGKEMRLAEKSILASYWSEFSKYSDYEVEIEGTFTRTLLSSRSGNRIVGAEVRTKQGGSLLFLPPLRYDGEKFTRYDSRREKEYWTPDGQKFGKRLVAAVVGLADSLKLSTESTPAPPWAGESQYRLQDESKLESAISTCLAEIADRQAKKAGLENELRQAGSLRKLLFEQGRPLENAIVEALKLLGFDAQPFSDGESEFDAVFVSLEGRCIGEAEGKDNKPINIDKFSQLERNIHEDFERPEVTGHAKGVLFGNAFRLLAIDERGDFFTEKCVSAAKRVGAALVRTPDLFAPAKYLKENITDVDYAKQCREAVFRTEGRIVVFPAPPIAQSISVVEQHAEQPKNNG
jgi:hypothetical protein